MKSKRFQKSLTEINNKIYCVKFWMKKESFFISIKKLFYNLIWYAFYDTDFDEL